MLTGLNKPVDFLITVLANEPVSIGFLTDEPLMNDMTLLVISRINAPHLLTTPVIWKTLFTKA